MVMTSTEAAVAAQLDTARARRKDEKTKRSSKPSEKMKHNYLHFTKNLYLLRCAVLDRLCQISFRPHYLSVRSKGQILIHLFSFHRTFTHTSSVRSYKKTNTQIKVIKRDKKPSRRRKNPSLKRLKSASSKWLT